MRCVRWLALGLVVIGATACGGGGDGETTDGPTTTIRVELSTTAPPPSTTTTTTTTTEEPPPLSEEDQIRRTAAELFDRGGELYLDPDPGLVAEIYDSQCPCYDAFEADLADLQKRGIRAATRTGEVLGSRLEDNSVPGLPSVTLVFEAVELVLVDESGAEIERRPGTEPVGFGIGLIQRNGRYLIATITPLDLVDTALQAIVAEGVP